MWGFYCCIISLSHSEHKTVQWTEVESLIKELQQFEGIQSVSKGRFSLSPGLAPTLQVLTFQYVPIVGSKSSCSSVGLMVKLAC